MGESPSMKAIYERAIDWLRLLVILAGVVAAGQCLKTAHQVATGPRWDNLGLAKKHLAHCKECRTAGVTVRQFASPLGGCVRSKYPN